LDTKAAPGGLADSGVTSFRRLHIEPAYKLVSAELERSILNGAFKPGAPLPTEKELSEQFGVNRSTIREAIRQIEQLGLVNRRQGRRLFVCMPGVSALSSNLMRSVLLQHVSFEDLWQVAMLLEPLAARLAAQAASASDLDEIRDNLNQAQQLCNTPVSPERNQALTELDVSFHALVARASNNRALMLAREPIGILFSPALTRLQALLPGAHARNLQAHQHVFDSMRERDAYRAELWMRRQIKDFQHGFALARLDMSVPITEP
jgi:GntR family transcriptional repressor for pyruvate dehydrogenase complex